jgi:nuclear transport factor 2 (NTF2) superfamily protein
MRAGLTEWLDAYGQAWEKRDPAAAAGLFAEDAVYQWGPFGKKLRGRPVIREAWAEATEQQQNVEFSYEVLAATGSGGLARWWCSYQQPERNVRVRIEGIFRLAFDESGFCTSLEEWYNGAEEPLDGARPRGT